MPKVSFTDRLKDALKRFEMRWECLQLNPDYRNDYEILDSYLGSWHKSKFSRPLSEIHGPGEYLFLKLPINVRRNWTEADEQAERKLEAFMLAASLKWSCNWLCHPNFANFESDTDFVSTDFDYVVKRFGALPLVNATCRGSRPRSSVKIVEMVKGLELLVTAPELRDLFGLRKAISDQTSKMQGFLETKGLPKLLEMAGPEHAVQVLPDESIKISDYDVDAEMESIFGRSKVLISLAEELTPYWDDVPSSFKERLQECSAVGPNLIGTFKAFPRRKNKPAAHKTAIQCWKAKQNTDPKTNKRRTDLQISMKEFKGRISQYQVKRYVLQWDNYIKHGCDF